MSASSNAMYLLHVPEERENTCHVCLKKVGLLTKEHVPPRSAFNDNQRLFSRIVRDGMNSCRQVRLNTQAGFWVQTVCGQCNNRLLAPYADEYVKFIKHIANHPTIVDASGAKRCVSVKCDPLYVAKEMAAMILAIEPLEYAIHNSDIRDFVRYEDQGIRPNFQVYGFLVPDADTSGTITPLHARVETFAPGERFMGGEVSLFPFGFVFASDIGPAYKPDRFTDITHWFANTSSSARQRLHGEFFTRPTGVDSIQAGLGYPRNHPHVDILK